MINFCNKFAEKNLIKFKWITVGVMFIVHAKYLFDFKTNISWLAIMMAIPNASVIFHITCWIFHHNLQFYSNHILLIRSNYYIFGIFRLSRLKILKRNSKIDKFVTWTRVVNDWIIITCGSQLGVYDLEVGTTQICVKTMKVEGQANQANSIFSKFKLKNKII